MKDTQIWRAQAADLASIGKVTTELGEVINIITLPDQTISLIAANSTANVTSPDNCLSETCNVSPFSWKSWTPRLLLCIGIQRLVQTRVYRLVSLHFFLCSTDFELGGSEDKPDKP